MAPLRRDATGRQVHDAFADPRPDKVSSLSSVGGAPVGSSYVTIANDATLTAERALAITAGQLVLADGGANASVTLSLADAIVAGGPIGNATTVPIITWDAKGRLTAVSSTAITGVPPGGAAGGDLSGTYPNPSVVDDSHNHTSTTLPATIVYDGDAAGGDLTGTYPNPTLAAIIAAAGPIGSATVTPIITYDAKGRLTVVSSATIAPLATSIASPAALTKVDDTNVTLTLGGTPTTALLRAASLTLGWTGQLAISRGGTGLSALGTGVQTWLGTPSSANLRAALTDETGTGAAVFADTPTLVTPILGTPTSGTLTNCTGLPISTGVSGLGANVATFLATPSSANLRGALTDETGTGVLVFGTAPTFTTNITCPLIYGGGTTSSHLDLYANDEAFAFTNTGRIRIQDRVTLPGSWSTSATVNDALITASGTITSTAATVIFPAFNDARTYSYSVNQSAATSMAFYASLTYAPTDNVTDASTVFSGFYAAPKYKLSTAAKTVTTPLLVGIVAQPRAQITAGTALTITNVTGVAASNATLYDPLGAFDPGLWEGTGALTVTNWRHFHCGDPATFGSYTVTNNVGLDIESLTIGSTLIAGVRSAITQGSGKWGLLFTGDADNSIEGGLRLGTDSGVPDTALHIAANSAATPRRAAITWEEDSGTPSNPTSGSQMRVYMRADKFIIQFNDGGTTRYKYLDLTGTGVTWTHTTTAPT